MSKLSSWLLYLTILITSLVPCLRLIRPGYFSMSDDMHIFRLQQFDQCLNDGQIPCRYVPLGGLGYGYPLFNFYSPLPYVLGEGFHLLGFSFINSIKSVFILCSLLSGFGMFLLAKSYWGIIGGIVSMVFYLFAPYRAVDTFVRGSLAELLALSLIPFILYFTIRYFKHRSKINFFYLTLFLSGLLLCHNLTALYTIPWLLLFSLIFYRLQIIKIIPPLLVSISLSAFFLFPAILEKNLVTVDTMTQGYFYYVAHFATLSQLFISRFWGFGASLWGPVDDLSFQLGIIHWLIPFILILYFSLKKNKHHHPFIGQLIFFSFSCLFFIFLTHNQSTFIWKLFPFMAYYQFPWRFVGPAVFCLSFIAGSSSLIFKSAPSRYLPLLLIIPTIILNYSYFKEDIWFPTLTDTQKLNPTNTINQSGMGLRDYWPNYGHSFPTTFAPQQPYSIDSSAIEVLAFSKKSNQVTATINTIRPTTVIFPIVNFPQWLLKVNNQPSPYSIEPNLGLLTVNLEPGSHHLVFSFRETPLRQFFNLLSLISLISLTIYTFKKP